MKRSTAGLASRSLAPSPIIAAPPLERARTARPTSSFQPPRVNPVERHLPVHGRLGEPRDLAIAAGEDVDSFDGHERGIDVEENEAVASSGQRAGVGPFLLLSPARCSLLAHERTIFSKS